MSDFDPKTAPHIPDWVAFRLDKLHQISSTTYLLAAIGQDIIVDGEGEKYGPNIVKLEGILKAIQFINDHEIEQEALDPQYMDKRRASTHQPD